MNPDQNILTVTETWKEISGQDENRKDSTYSNELGNFIYLPNESSLGMSLTELGFH